MHSLEQHTKDEWPLCAETASLVLNACFAAGSPDPASVAHAAAQRGVALGLATPLSPLKATFWRCLATYLHRGHKEQSNEAACAVGAVAQVERDRAERHFTALEQVCEEPLRLLDMVSGHIEEQEPCCAVVCQLLAIAETCVDFGDAVARTTATKLCERLVSKTLELRCAVPYLLLVSKAKPMHFITKWRPYMQVSGYIQMGPTPMWRRWFLGGSRGQLHVCCLHTRAGYRTNCLGTPHRYRRGVSRR